MAMRNMSVNITGINPILLNNPQTVDSFNSYSKRMKVITSKRAKTDEDMMALRDLEIEAKIYWDDELKLYVPTTWVTAALAGWSFKKAKISKADIRSAVFTVSPKAKLHYRDDDKVKEVSDIVGNHAFRHTMTLKQGQVRIVKAAPIFHNWAFTVELEFDGTVIDPATLEQILIHASKYGGYGDFRPTFGRALTEVSHG